MNILFEIYQTDKIGLTFLNSKWFETKKRLTNPLYNILFDFDLHDPYFGYLCVFSDNVDIQEDDDLLIVNFLVTKINTKVFSNFYSRPISISDVIRINDKLFFVDIDNFISISSNSI